MRPIAAPSSGAARAKRRVEHGSPAPHGGDRDDHERAGARAHDPSEPSRGGALEQELRRDVPPGAPSARRSPISPTRSSTDTSVTLAMPIAPTSSDTPPSSTKRTSRSLRIAPLSSRGSGGDATFSSRQEPGLSAIGAWRVISGAAPTLARSAPARAPEAVFAGGGALGHDDRAPGGWLAFDASRMPITRYRRSPRKIAGCARRG